MDRHLFICTGPTCSAEGAEESLQAMNQSLSKRGLCRGVRVTLARCLGQCGNGPIMVIYPEGVWYGHVGPREAEEIVRDHLMNGKPVPRLVQIPVD